MRFGVVSLFFLEINGILFILLKILFLKLSRGERERVREEGGGGGIIRNIF